LTGKFCAECGTPLRPRCERRQVSVLLVDVSGFTAMSERLDPEEIRCILGPAFEVIEDAVHLYDGAINQFLGDGVMALFGVVAGLEDHPRRALRAAIAIQEGLEPLREAVRHEHRVEFGVRMGVHSGPVVLGVIGRDLRTDYTAAGQTTSLAARLVNLARAGEIVVSDSTRALAGGSFAFAELSRLDITEGRADVIRAYAMLRGPREPGGRQLGGLASSR
jgi:class 3 adenylate cyclase